MKFIPLGLVALCLCALPASLMSQSPAIVSGDSVTTFGQTPDHQTAQLYTLRNHHGCEAKITNYGATVVSLTMPDRAGKLDDVVLGFESLAKYVAPEYLAHGSYFGCTAGRCANRIARGRFTLENKEYQLPLSDPPNSLHGGFHGFDKHLWSEVAMKSDDTGSSLTLRWLSKDGEEGYPGNLTATVVYTLTDRDELKVDLTATTDQTTIVNLTHHSYFNLGGADSGTVLNHELTLHAAKFTPVDAGSIPTGELRQVAGTPFDFTTAHKIGERINADDPQIKYGSGYDHNFVIDGDHTATAPRKAARVYDAASGRVLEVETTAPGVQFYSGNFLAGQFVGKGGKPYVKYSGFCLEPQAFPDSVNKPAFPSVVLKPGETYRNSIVYRFSVER